MVMVGQEKRLSEPLSWTRAGRFAVSVTALLLVAAAIAGGAWAIFASHKSRQGCIDVAFASTLGVAEIHPCAGRARELCANPSQNPAAEAHGALQDACEKAGLPYGTGAHSY